MKSITVNVVVLSAKGLKSKTGKHKFCVQAKIGKNKQKTNVVEDLFGNPSFNKEFILFADSLNNELKLKVTEKNDKDVLGQVVVRLSDLCQEKNPNPDRVPLRSHRNCHTPSGELLFDAWITESSVSNLNLAEKSTSRESLKSLGGFKKLKEKLRASALKLNTSKDDKSEMKKSHLSIFPGKSKGLFHLKKKTSMSCQDLSGSQNALRPFQGKIQLETYKCSNEDITHLGSESSNENDKNSAKDFIVAPEITRVSPNLADCKGGTVVTIRGSNLGKNAEDVIHVYICGLDLTSQIKYINSKKLLCTTLPCNPSKGNVAVVTQSGGLGTSSMTFTFYGLPESNSLSISPNNDKIFHNHTVLSSPALDKSLHIASPSPPPRFNHRIKDLGVIEESVQDDPSETCILNDQKPSHKKNLSLSRSSIFLSINQSPPNSSKRLSLFNADDDLGVAGCDSIIKDHVITGKGNFATSNVETNSIPMANNDPKNNKLNFESHDLTTPEGIKLFYSSSDVGLVERLSEYYQKPTEPVVPLLKSTQGSLSDTCKEEEFRPSNKLLDKVIFSIGGDVSSDDESVKKVKNPSQPSSDNISTSKNSSETDISDSHSITLKPSDQVTVKKVVEIQPISRRDILEIENKSKPSLNELSTEDQVVRLGGPHYSNDLHDMEERYNDRDIPSSQTPKLSPPTKPPRIREFAEMSTPPPTQLARKKQDVPDDFAYRHGKVDDLCSEDMERVKKLEEEIYAKEISMQELRDQNKTLREERNLLRRYIEVLISRALSICPEILCNDGGKISFS